MVDASAFSESYTWDGDNNRITVTDRRGKRSSEYTFDSRGNVLTKEDPLSHTWEYTWSSANDLLSEEDPLGN